MIIARREKHEKPHGASTFGFNLCGHLTSALTHLMFTTLQWYGHSHVHTTVRMARCVQAAVV